MSIRFGLLLLVPCALMGETIVSATVNCGNGPVGGPGVFSASCSFPATGGPGNNSALAFVSFVPAFGPSPYFVYMFIDNHSGPGVTSGSAELQADFVVTINAAGMAGTSGFYRPCLVASGEVHEAAGSVHSQGEFQMDDLPPVYADSDILLTDYSCPPPPNMVPPSDPFTFGQPFILHGSFGASGGAGTAIVEFDGFEVADTNGNLISDATFTLVAVPEPRAAAFVIPPLALILLLAFRRRAPQRR